MSGETWSASPFRHGTTVLGEMRILYFSTRDCWPTSSGARLRDYYLARELSRRAELTYLGFKNTDTPVWRGKQGPSGELDSILVARPRAYSIAKIARGFIGPAPVNVLNFATALMEAQLRQILDEKNVDLVQMEGVHLSSYVPIIRAARSRPRLICDWHNIESELMRRYSENSETGLGKRLYAARAASLLERLEYRLLTECDAHLVCSERERRVLQERVPAAPIRVVSNGVDAGFQIAAGHNGNLAARRDLVFVGSMDYHANIDGALYFAREIWPPIYQSFPSLRFVIVGSRPAPEILALQGNPGIVVTGTVDDVRPYYQNAAAVVVPLRVGSGTRLKVLEAMAAAVPVISTRLGVEGLQVKDGEDLFLADTPGEFAAAVLALNNDESKWKRVAAAARETARTRYDWPLIGESLFQFYSRSFESSVA
jgi:glycosyltransferase involved in cell wall biosynthesis